MSLSPFHLADSHLSFSFQLKMSPCLKALHGTCCSLPLLDTLTTVRLQSHPYTLAGLWGLIPCHGPETRAVSPWSLGEHLAPSRHSTNICCKWPLREVHSRTRRALVGLTWREKRQYFGKQINVAASAPNALSNFPQNSPKGHALLRHFAGLFQELARIWL